MLPLAALAAASLLAQTPPPAFEVASVKLAPQRTGEARFTRLTETPGRISYANVSLKLLVCRAYKQSDDTVSGGGEWVDSTLYDVEATLPAGSSKDQIPAMLQTLLAERLGLVTHTAMKEGAGYDLVVSRKGAKLQKSDEENTANPAILKGRIVAPRIAMSTFAGIVARQVGRPVNDKTGLPGLFNIDFDWSPDAAADGSDALTTGPSLFAALPEQLGLELHSGRANVQHLLIDKANRVPVE